MEYTEIFSDYHLLLAPKAAQTLVHEGIHGLKGGMQAWTRESYNTQQH